MTLCCVTNSWWCSGKMLGLFLPATLWANWKVLYGNTWSLATGQTPDFELEGSGYTAGVCFGL